MNALDESKDWLYRRLEILSNLSSNIAGTTPAGQKQGSEFNTLNKYQSIYTNNTGEVLAIRVRATFSAGGQGLKLSRTLDLSDLSLIDTLSQGVKEVSDWIMLRNRDQLYANTKDTGADLTGAIFNLDLFDFGYFEKEILR